MRVSHQQEGGRNVVVLHRACIVVQQSQRVTGLDQEVVVHASVLVVVDDSGEVAGKKLGEEYRLSLC